MDKDQPRVLWQENLKPQAEKRSVAEEPPTDDAKGPKRREIKAETTDDGILLCFAKVNAKVLNSLREPADGPHTPSLFSSIAGGLWRA